MERELIDLAVVKENVIGGVITAMEVDREDDGTGTMWLTIEHADAPRILLGVPRIPEDVVIICDVLPDAPCTGVMHESEVAHYGDTCPVHESPTASGMLLTLPEDAVRAPFPDSVIEACNEHNGQCEGDLIIEWRDMKINVCCDVCGMSGTLDCM